MYFPVFLIYQGETNESCLFHFIRNLRAAHLVHLRPNSLKLIFFATRPSLFDSQISMSINSDYDDPCLNLLLFVFLSSRLHRILNDSSLLSSTSRSSLVLASSKSWYAITLDSHLHSLDIPNLWFSYDQQKCFFLLKSHTQIRIITLSFQWFMIVQLLRLFDWPQCFFG